MQLSPLNLFGLVNRIRAVEKQRSTSEGSRVEEIVMYRCKSCGETYEWKDDAEDCCALSENSEKPACPVCGEYHLTFRDAADCCLWKDLSAIDRWRIADAVEAGSDWATELKVKEH